MGEMEAALITTDPATVAPPDKIVGFLGEDGALLDAPNGKRIGGYEIAKEWKAGKGRVPMALVYAQTNGVVYRGTCSPFPMAHFTGRSKEAWAEISRENVKAAHAKNQQTYSAQLNALQSAQKVPDRIVSPPIAKAKTALPVATLGTYGAAVMFNGLRRQAVELLRAVSPADYTEYGRFKYQFGDEVPIEHSREAYAFVFRRLLALCYDEVGAY